MILLFAGAGASYAINKEKYPTTVEFWNRMSDDIKSDIKNALNGLLNKEISTPKEESPMDIEKVLKIIYEFVDYLSPGIDEAMMVTPFFKSYIPDLSQQRHYLKELIKIENDVYREMHDVYIQEPSGDDAKLWTLLIKNLLDQGEEIDLFTTNYDIVLEKAINMTGGRFFYRKDDGTGSVIDTTVFSTASTAKKKNRFIKLHGSVNWHFKNKSSMIGVGFDHYIEDRDTRAILYPSDKMKSSGRTIIFDMMLNQLGIACQSCDTAIFVGVSFRDDHINQFLKIIPVHVKKLIIDRHSDINQLIHGDFPFDGHDFEYIGGGFNTASVKKIIQEFSGA